LTTPAVAPQTATPIAARSTALQQQLALERSVIRTIIRGMLVALLPSIGILIGMMALAMSDKQPWYVWVGLGTGIGTYAAGFLGMITGVTIAAHRLDGSDSNTEQD
jgi:hypothetical protein